MYTPRIRWTLSLFFLILLLGIGLQNSLILLALIPLSINIIIYFITRPVEKENLEITRELEHTRFQEGEIIEIILKVKNKGKTIDILEILDRLPLEVSLKSGSNHVITSLNAGEETTICYTFSCDYRGRWKLGPTEYRIRNFLDTAYTTGVSEQTLTNFVVIPNFEIIREVFFRIKYPKISDGPFHSKFKGEGLDFTGVREYTSSDAISRINWLAFAKHNRLFTNEYELYRSADLLLILDATEMTGSIINDSIKAVLSLTEHFLKYKCRVGLLIIRDHVDHFTLTASRQQLLKITEMLIDIQPTKIDRLEMLERRIETNLNYFPNNCLTIIITPLIDWRVNQLFRKVARRKRNCFFLSPSIIASEWRYVRDKETPENVLVHQDLLIKRKIEVTKISQQGIPILEWDVSVPFTVFTKKLKFITTKRGGR